MKPPPPPSSAVPAGWYDDPADGTRRRYWDGAEWTNQIAPKEPPGIKTFRGEGSPQPPVVVKKHGCLSAIGAVVVVVVVLIAALLVWGAATTDTGSGDASGTDTSVSIREAIAKCLSSGKDGHLTHLVIEAALQARTPPRYLYTVNVRPLSAGTVTGNRVDLRLTYKAVDNAGIERTYHVDAEMTLDCEIEDVIEDTGEVATYTAPAFTSTIPAAPFVVTVPDVYPSGRCLAELEVYDEYAWEQCHLWGITPMTAETLPTVTLNEARRLVAFIWNHTVVDGMPVDVPTLQLGNQCSDDSCRPFYETAHHTIWIPRFPQQVVPVTVLLHEVAHALLPGQVVTHNDSDIFRCVLEHLYDAYGGFPATGMCGNSDAPIELPEQSNTDPQSDSVG